MSDTTPRSKLATGERALLCACIWENRQALILLANGHKPLYMYQNLSQRGMEKCSQRWTMQEIHWALDDEPGEAFSSLKMACGYLGLSYSKHRAELMPFINKIRESLT